jgi:hypothetical protein
VRARHALWLALAWLLATSAQAHVASNGFLVLNVHDRELSGSVEMAVRDAELAVGVDANGDGQVTWGELREAAPRLTAYLAAHLNFVADGRGCSTRFGQLRVTARVDGNYAWLPITSECGARPRELTIRYHLLEGIDPSHRGLLRLEGEGTVASAVLGGRAADVSMVLGRSFVWRTIAEYLEAGIWHIWSGIDHLLFLLSLLLPAVLQRCQGRWEPVASGRPAFFGILKVVTAFTVAHSITLSLAALDVVRLPGRFTESVIAASIIVAALNNIFPVVTETRARIAFAFGLLHGFGFASVLAEMGLPAGARLVSLLAFNCGIEAGQLAVVLAVMPLAYALRKAALYRYAVLPWGSAAIAAVALVWFVQRAFLLQ